MKFIFQGIPISKARPRACIIKNGANSKIKVYDKQHRIFLAHQVKLKSLISGYFSHKDSEIVKELKEMANAKAFDVEMRFCMPYPQKLNQIKNKCISEDFKNITPNYKPDIDNLCKFYLDVANKLLYRDDSQIVSLKAIKEYSLNPRTEFIITPHNKENHV